jgi:hypothetical protein
MPIRAFRRPTPPESRPDVERALRSPPCPPSRSSCATRNRKRLLTACLASLDEQRFERNEYEVVVVDNASSDYARDLDRAGHDDVCRLAYGHGLLADDDPLGLIEAFTSAFAPGDGASLLLKTMNSASQVRAADASRWRRAGTSTSGWWTG